MRFNLSNVCCVYPSVLGLEIHNQSTQHLEKPAMGIQLWKSKIGLMHCIIGTETMMGRKWQQMHSYYAINTGYCTFLLFSLAL